MFENTCLVPHLSLGPVKSWELPKCRSWRKKSCQVVHVRPVFHGFKYTKLQSIPPQFRLRWDGGHSWSDMAKHPIWWCAMEVELNILAKVHANPRAVPDNWQIDILLLTLNDNCIKTKPPAKKIKKNKKRTVRTCIKMHSKCLETLLRCKNLCLSYKTHCNSQSPPSGSTTDIRLYERFRSSRRTCQCQAASALGTWET